MMRLRINRDMNVVNISVLYKLSHYYYMNIFNYGYKYINIYSM